MASDYEHLYRDIINFLITIANEQLPGIELNHLEAYDSVEKFMPHKSRKTNDVQIVYTGDLDRNLRDHVYDVSKKEVQL